MMGPGVVISLCRAPVLQNDPNTDSNSYCLGAYIRAQVNPCRGRFAGHHSPERIYKEPSTPGLCSSLLRAKQDKAGTSQLSMSPSFSALGLLFCSMCDLELLEAC